jgi:hypothetical protein
LPVVSTAALIEIELSAPAIGALVGLAGVLIGLWVSGNRAERQRRRNLHARALESVFAYAEMPFMIRRRRHENEHRSAERVRLSDHFSGVKAEMGSCQVLLAADGDESLSRAFEELVEVARATAGAEAHTGWTEEPISKDGQMNMGPLFDRMQPLWSRLKYSRMS